MVEDKLSFIYDTSYKVKQMCIYTHTHFKKITILDKNKQTKITGVKYTFFQTWDE